MITTSLKIIVALSIICLGLLFSTVKLYSSLEVEKHKVIEAANKFQLMEKSFTVAILNQNASIEESAKVLQQIGDQVTSQLELNKEHWRKLDSKTALEVKRLSTIIPKDAPCEKRVEIFGEELLKLKQ